jgi:hypothetical protein
METEEERKKREAEEAKKSGLNWLLDKLNPFSGDGGGFGLGSIFTILLVVTGVYFLARNEKVQEFVGGLFGEGGKEKIAGLMEDVNAGIAHYAPWLAKMMGIEGADVEKLAKSSDEERTELLTKAGMPAPAVAIINANSKAFFETLKEINGGNYPSGADLLNEKNIVGLLTKQPALMKQLVPALMPAEGATPTDDQKKQQLKIYASLKKVVNSSDLDLLLNATNRKNTIEILAAVSPDKTSTPEAIEANLSKLMDANGAPKESLRLLLSKMLTPDDNGELPKDMKTAVAALMADEKTPADAKSDFMNLALENPDQIAGAGNGDKLTTLRSSIGDDKMQQLMALGALPDAEAKDASFALITQDVPTLMAFRAFADGADIRTLPENLKKPVENLKKLDARYIDALWGMKNKGVTGQEAAQIQTILAPNGDATTTNDVIAQLFDANNRALLMKAHPNNINRLIYAAMPPDGKGADGKPLSDNEQKKRIKTVNFMKPENITALLNSVDQIDRVGKAMDATAAAAGDTSAPGTTMVKKVFSALVGLVDGHVEDFKKLSAGEVATLFKIPEFSSAMGQMIRGLKLPAGSKESAMLASLQKYWGTITEDKTRTKVTARNGEGLAEVLADEASAQVLIDGMNGKKPDVGPGLNFLHYAHLWRTEKTDAEDLHYYLTYDAPVKLKENGGYMEQVTKDLKAAGVSLFGGTATPAETAAIHAQYNKDLAHSRKLGKE